MELEKQVCSLEHAKRLKELGVKQLDNSLWAWAETCVGTHPVTHQNIWGHTVVANDFQADFEFVAAFTVAELGTKLGTFESDNRGSRKNKFRVHKHCKTVKKGWYFKKTYADTEANARAKMLVYLIENELINVQLLRQHQ
jgi:hypothetical protein